MVVWVVTWRLERRGSNSRGVVESGGGSGIRVEVVKARSRVVIVVVVVVVKEEFHRLS